MSSGNYSEKNVAASLDDIIMLNTNTGHVIGSIIYLFL